MRRYDSVPGVRLKRRSCVRLLTARSFVENHEGSCERSDRSPRAANGVSCDLLASDRSVYMPTHACWLCAR